jgi:high affinity sulfate transporter 1
MAYAGIAGVPPLLGVFTVPLPLLAYACLGTSRTLNVGPDSATALISYNVIGGLAVAGSAEFIGLTVTMTMLVGVLFLLLGLLRTGWVANFISVPVMRGFIQGLVWVTIVGQIPKLLAVASPHGEFFGKTFELIRESVHANPATATIGLSSLAMLLVLKKCFPRIPAGLTTSTVAVLAVTLLNLHQYGVETVGRLDSGLPSLHVPKMSFADLSFLGTGALAIALLGYCESLGAAKAAGRQVGGDIDSNKELIALGGANVGSAICGGFVAVGSLSKTSVAIDAGAKTQLSSVVQAALVLLTLAFLMPLFTNLPQATLAAIVISAMLSLANFAYLRRLYFVSPGEFCAAATALVGVLVLGVLPGLGLGVGLTAIMLTYRSSYPNTAVLGKMPGVEVYRDVARHPEAQTIPGVLIFRFDASPFFANAAHLERHLKACLRHCSPSPSAVIVDCESMNSIDSTAMDMFIALHAELQARLIVLYFARVKDPVREAMQRAEMEDAMGRDCFFDQICDAVQAHSSRERAATAVVEKIVANL